MQAASLLPSYGSVKQSFLPVLRRPLQVRCQSFREEGRFSNMVDTNLGVLRERIEVMKERERLERCLRRRNEYGWNYATSYNYKLKKDKEFAQFLELIFVVSGSLGFTCLGGSFFLCLISLLVHFSH